MLATRANSVKTVQLLLKANPDLSKQDAEGASVLHFAIGTSNEVLVAMLVKAGAPLGLKDHEGSTLLHEAAKQGSMRLVNALLTTENSLQEQVNVTDRTNSTPLHYAAMLGHSSFVSFLLERGASVSIRDDTGRTALYHACLNGHADIVKKFLSLSSINMMALLASGDTKGRTPLHAASCFGHWEVVASLLEHGADSGAQDTDLQTPVHLAAANGSLMSLTAMAKTGANLNAQTREGVFPLHLAVGHGHLDCVHFLCESDVDMACRDEMGDTPLHYATRAGETDAVRYILNRTKGIVTNLKNKHGQTSLHYAALYKAPVIAVLLVQYKGNPDGRDTLGQSPIKLAHRSSPAVKEVFRELARLPQPLSAEDASRLLDTVHRIEQSKAGRDGRAERQLRKNKVNALRLASPRSGVVDRGAMALTHAEDQLALRMDYHKPTFPRLRNSQGGSFASSTGPPAQQQITATKTSFGRVGFDCDLNDPASLADALSERCDSLSARVDLLNLLRLLLLAPQPSCGIRNLLWDTLQRLCAALVLPDLSGGYRLTLEKFLRARDSSDLYQDQRFCEDRARQLAQTQAAVEQILPQLSLVGGPQQQQIGTVSSPAADQAKDGSKGKDKGKEPSTVGAGGLLTATAATANSSSSSPATVGPDQLIFRLPGEVPKLALSVQSSSSLAAGTPPPPPPPPNADGSAAPPPPPPPPPGPRGGPPAPPPPPGGGPPKPVAKRNMRRLNWSKVPRNQINHTTFGRNGALRDVYLDTSSILKYFLIKPQEKDKTNSGQSKVQKQAQQKINVIDLKRANQIGIMLKGLSCDMSSLRKAFLKLEGDFISTDHLRTFSRLTPTDQDREALAQYRSAPPEVLARLGEADRYFLEVMDVPRLKERLDVFVFKRDYAEQTERIKEGMGRIATGLSQLRENNQLSSLLDVILFLGNFLNEGTHAGDALGVRFDSVLRLQDTRSPQLKSYTLLDYLVWYLSQFQESLLSWPDSVPDAYEARVEHIEAVNLEYKHTTQGLKHLESELEHLKKSDSFRHTLRKFYQTAKKETDSLGAELKKIREQHTELSKYYCADQGGDIGLLVHSFRLSFCESAKKLPAMQKVFKISARSSHRTGKQELNPVTLEMETVFQNPLLGKNLSRKIGKLDRQGRPLAAAAGASSSRGQSRRKKGHRHDTHRKRERRFHLRKKNPKEEEPKRTIRFGDTTSEEGEVRELSDASQRDRPHGLSKLRSRLRRVRSSQNVAGEATPRGRSRHGPSPISAAAQLSSDESDSASDRASSSSSFRSRLRSRSRSRSRSGSRGNSPARMRRGASTRFARDRVSIEGDLLSSRSTDFIMQRSDLEPTPSRDRISAALLIATGDLRDKQEQRDSEAAVAPQMRRRKSINANVRKIRRNIFSVLEPSKRDTTEEPLMDGAVDWKKQLSKIRAERRKSTVLSSPAERDEILDLFNKYALPESAMEHSRFGRRPSMHGGSSFDMEASQRARARAMGRRHSVAVHLRTSGLSSRSVSVLDDDPLSAARDSYRLRRSGKTSTPTSDSESSFHTPPLSRTSSSNLSFVGKLEEPEEEEVKQVKFQSGMAPSTDEGETSTPPAQRHRLPVVDLPRVAKSKVSGSGARTKESDDKEMFTPREDSVIVVAASALSSGKAHEILHSEVDDEEDPEAELPLSQQRDGPEDEIPPLEKLQLLFPDLLEEVLFSLLESYDGDATLCQEWLEMKGWRPSLPANVINAAGRSRKRGTIKKGWGSVKAALRSKNSSSSNHSIGPSRFSPYSAASGDGSNSSSNNNNSSNIGGDRIGQGRSSTFGRVRGRRDFLAKSLNQSQAQAHAN